MAHNFRINGVERQLPDQKLPVMLTDLLQRLGMHHSTVVAEIDGRVIERSRFAETEITEGANIELVHFLVGG